MNISKFLLNGTLFPRCIQRWMSASTIYSLSSGYGKCGVSVVRVSGPQTMDALRAIVGSKYKPKDRYAHLKALHHPVTREMIDKGLVLWFPGPASFTGEDSCEFQVHGSLAVVAALLEALGQVPGLRPATPGEFTKRAFYGGKLDLTEVEGLADLIHAETEAQRKQALLQSNGALSRLYDSWRKRLIHSAAHLEAYIDFAEDENIEDDTITQLTADLQLVAKEISDHLNDQRQGEMLRDGVRTAIIGAPNVGKSSFLNLMCQRQVSIVTPIAGTTRDIIETTYSFAGYPVLFADTAGLRRQTDDPVELEGMERAKECVAHADLILLLIDAQELVAKQVSDNERLKEYIKQYMKELDLDMAILNEKAVQLVANKVDLISSHELEKICHLNSILCISCKDAKYEKPFLSKFHELLESMCGTPTPENPRITHQRYRQQLEQCINCIEIFLTKFSPDTYPDLAISAQKLRKAIKCIERITGHVSSDDILDVVFRDFCIGK